MSFQKSRKHSPFMTKMWLTGDKGQERSLGLCNFSFFQDGKETLRLAGKGGIGVDTSPSNSKHS